jgi:RimJ/RimL family protein N-acetyltransferase
LFGLINIHPKYHRTHVNSHAMHLILSFLFDEAHMLRVQYDALTWHKVSQGVALRFGFKPEGICRNLGGVVPEHKKKPWEKQNQSQDLWLSSMTVEDWNKGGRERLSEMAAREPVDTTKRCTNI